MRKLIRGVMTGAACLVVGVAACAGPAFATDDPIGGRSGAAPADGPPPELLAVLQRDLGLSADEAKQRAAAQAKSMEIDKALKGKLGADYAGSWLDTKSGELIVAISDERKRSAVQAAGADVRVVKHSRAKLDGIVAELDRQAGKVKGSSAADRRVPGKRQAAVAGLSAWRVDPTTNDVVVSVVKGKQNSAAIRALAKYGDAVRVEQLDAAPAVGGDYMDGGDAINGASCSAGFNLRNPSTGQGYLLTAGHCVSAGSTLRGQGWNWFGTVLESWFPGADDAIARKQNSYWVQGPWVDKNPSNGGILTVAGYSDPPLFAYVCKSGITTKLTCGQVWGTNETVTYPGYGTVYGLTRHSACFEPGDSGGATYQFTGGANQLAAGVGSGGVFYGDAKRCGSAVGLGTTSWYFPIADSLAYYGPKYGVQVW